jgi:hypothetical protein
MDDVKDNDKGEDKGEVRQAFCVKCKEKRDMTDAKEITMKNGRAAMKGTCGVCGTGMFSILGMKKKEG